MTDDSKKKNGDKRIWRFVFAAMVFLAALQVLGYLACWLIGSVLGGISFSVPAASVGIIGGADGPTAIFVTGMAKPEARPVAKPMMRNVTEPTDPVPAIAALPRKRPTMTVSVRL